MKGFIDMRHYGWCGDSWCGDSVKESTGLAGRMVVSRRGLVLARIGVCLCFAIALRAAEVAQETTLTNGGFEPHFAAGVAHGWSDNSYGDVTVRYSEETNDVHSGKSCQKLEVLSFAPGSGVQFCQNVDMQAGKTYTLSAWMRAEGIVGPVMILLRRGPSPYDHWLYKWVAVTDEWRKFTVIGAAAGEDPADNRFYIHFRGNGTLWVDDAAMREGAFPDETDQTVDLGHLPPGGPNLLANASFEVGFAGWAPIDRVLVPGLAIEPTTAAHGRFALKARVNPRRISLDEMERTVTSLYLPIGARARPFTVSLYLKGEPDARIRFGLYSTGHHIEKVVTLTGDWKRYAVSGLVGGPESMKGSAHVAVTGEDGPVDVWIDAVQVQEGGLTLFAPASSVEVAGYPTRPDATFLKAETPEIDLWWSSSAAPDWTFRVEDFWNREVPAELVVEGRSGAPPGRTRVAVKTAALGIFRLLVSARSGPAAGTAEVVFLRSPEPPATSRFGVHGKTYVATGQPIAYGRGRYKAFAPFVPDFAQRIGAKWWRLHDVSGVTDWCLAEPKPGEYIWFDPVIDGLRERGFQILGMLTRTPDWAARDSRNNANGRSVPRDVQDFADFVTRIARHYKDRIRYWELWNTPGDPGFWAGTPEEYVALLKVGSEALKQVDPENKVVSVWLGYEREQQATNEKLLAAGLTNHLDIYGFHGYGGEAALRNMEHFRAIADRHGGMKPVWETEAGAYCATFRRTYFDGAEAVGTQWSRPVDYQTATAAWVRSVATSLAAGSERYFFYWVVPTGLPSQQYDAPNLVDFDGTPRPLAAAYAVSSHWLSEARPVRAIDVTDRVRALVFERDEGPIAVIYGLGMPAPDTQTLRLPLAAANFERIDIMGNRHPVTGESEATLGISSEPFYLLAPAMTAPELIAAIQAGHVEGTPVPNAILDKLRNYGMELSTPFFREHRFVETLSGLGGTNAYRFAADNGEVLVLWHGQAGGVVQDLPKERLLVCSPKEKIEVTDALGHRVVLAASGAHNTFLDVSFVPVFVACPKGVLVQVVTQSPQR